MSVERKLHAHAETKWTEFWTSFFIAEKLDGMGYDVRAGIEVVDPEFCAGRPSEAEIDTHDGRALPRCLPRMAETDEGIYGSNGSPGNRAARPFSGAARRH